MPNTPEVKRLNGNERGRLFSELRVANMLPQAGQHLRKISTASNEDERQLLETLSPFLLKYINGDNCDGTD